jgi:hypothetical protein
LPLDVADGREFALLNSKVNGTRGRRAIVTWDAEPWERELRSAGSHRIGLPAHWEPLQASQRTAITAQIETREFDPRRAVVTESSVNHEKERPRRPTLPGEWIDPSAQAHLDRKSRRVLSILRAIFLTSSFRAQIPLEELAVRLFTDPEEGWKRIILSAKVRCLPAQALAFWDYVGAQIDDWKATLPEEQAEFLVNTFSACVDW